MHAVKTSIEIFVSGTGSLDFGDLDINFSSFKVTFLCCPTYGEGVILFLVQIPAIGIDISMSVHDVSRTSQICLSMTLWHDKKLIRF